MDAEPTQQPDDLGHRVQVDNALRAIHQKKPVPEVDFTLHTMEDGTQVNTMERVCKGLYPYYNEASSRKAIPADIASPRCSSSCNAPPH